MGREGHSPRIIGRSNSARFQAQGPSGLLARW